MNRHRTDITSLIAGLMFVAFSVLIVLDRTDQIDLDARWIPAVVLIGLGLANLLGSLMWRQADPIREPPIPEPADQNETAEVS